MSNPVTSPVTPTFSSQLPTALYRAEQVRALDRCAIEEHNIAGIVLMKRAGRAAFEALLQRWPDPEQITVLCGAGNNAGDGYVIAALAAQRRVPVEVMYLSDPEKLKGDASLAYQFARREGVVMQPFAVPARCSGIIVDALLGTGLSGVVRSNYQQAIEKINSSGLPVLAVDIPSGLCADSGQVLGAAVNATLTVSFIGLKRGLLTGRGPALCGELLYADLQVPAAVLESQVPAAQRLQLPRLLAELAPRAADAHKGSFGHVMVVGGDLGFAGAAALAAETAARIGAGLTSVATRAEHLAAILARRPELMVSGVASGLQLEPLLQRATVLVVGPGLGQSPWSEQLLQCAAASNLPMVLDADGLNLLAAGRVLGRERRANWVLTPHPGEAARLLGCSVAEVQQDRFAAVARLQQQYGGSVLLKGAGTVIASRDGSLSLANVGNPGMASGGMGDVLSGVIGGLLAQGVEQDLAVQLAVCLHGTAADLAAEEDGQRGMLAADLIPWMRQLLNSGAC